MFRFAQHDEIPCVIASVSEAINRVGILCLLITTLAPLARNDPPPSPLRKGGEYLATANFGGATLVALIYESNAFMILCAVKTAAPM